MNADARPLETRAAADLAADGNPLHLHVAVAADHGFAMPLGVTLSSALRALAPGWGATIYVLDGGLTAHDRERLEHVVGRTRRAVEWRWVRVEREQFDGVMTTEALTHVSYHRLLIPDIAPPDVDRMIYLDSDVVVRHDLSRLWAEPLGGAPFGAVRDLVVPTVSSGCGLRGLHDALGLAADAPYFNSGVLLIDLAAWRREDLSARALAFTRDHRDDLLWADQDGLNAVTGGAWHELGLRWNVQVGALASRGGQGDPLLQSQVARLEGDPGVVHFTGPAKPWRPWCPDAEGQAYFDAALRASGWFRPAHRMAWTARRRALTLAARGRFYGGGVLRRLGLRRDRALTTSA